MQGQSPGSGYCSPSPPPSSKHRLKRRSSHPLLNSLVLRLVRIKVSSDVWSAQGACFGALFLLFRFHLEPQNPTKSPSGMRDVVSLLLPGFLPTWKWSSKMPKEALKVQRTWNRVANITMLVWFTSMPAGCVSTVLPHASFFSARRGWSRGNPALPSVFRNSNRKATWWWTEAKQVTAEPKWF